MKKVIFKFALLAIVIIGSISIMSCEEKEEQEPIPSEKPYNPFTGTWVCTDELYTESGTLQLVFGEDNTVVTTNTTGEPSVFDNLNTVYDFRGNYLYFDGRSSQYYFHFHSDSNLYILNYTIDHRTGNATGWPYNFERVGGSK
jgi:hypothetical protein